MIACCTALQAQQFFSWHVVDSAFNPTQRLNVVVHQRTRTLTNSLDQVRGGTIARYSLPKAVVYGGHYFQPQHQPGDQWTRGHRFFAGVERTTPVGSGLTLTGRVAAERFLGTGREDYNRYRSYLRLLIGQHRLTPYLQNEVLAVRHGFHSMRNSGGLRIRVSPTLSLEVGGLYDFRQTEWGGDRVAIVTGVRWTPAGR